MPCVVGEEHQGTRVIFSAVGSHGCCTQTVRKGCGLSGGNQKAPDRRHLAALMIAHAAPAGRVPSAAKGSLLLGLAVAVLCMLA
jgi:hypothetical protein